MPFLNYTLKCGTLTIQEKVNIYINPIDFSGVKYSGKLARRSKSYTRDY